MKRVDGLAGSTAPATKPATKTTHRRHVVLYVEDEEANRSVAELMLGRRCELISAADSRSACHLLRTRGKDLDIILMDIQLKGAELDGIQLTKLIRGQLPAAETPTYARGLLPLSIPLFFLTAYGERYHEDELRAAGGNGVFHKPVDFAKVMGSITRAILAGAGLGHKP